MNLYKITNEIGEFYCVAKDYGEAQLRVESFLDKEEYSFSAKRKTLRIELIATESLENDFPILIPNK